jgi:hypothetical protein
MAAVKKVASMTRSATARREGRFWVVDVDGVGTTQGRSVREARTMAADLVEVMTGKAEPVEVEFLLPGETGQRLKQMRALSAEAQRLATEAAEGYRAAVAELVGTEFGLSKADVAALLDLSPQRVNQLVPATRSRPAGVTGAPNAPAANAG